MKVKNLLTLAVALLCAGSSWAEDYPQDMTSYIKNPEINGANGWTTEIPKGGNGPLLNGNSFEYWNGTAANGAFDYYQVITGLPDGKYTVSAEMYNSTNGVQGAIFSATSGVYATNILNKEVYKLVDVDGEQLKQYTTDAIIVVNGTLRIGVKNQTTMTARWFVADNFKLTLVADLNLDEYIEGYQDALTVANGIVDEKMAPSIKAALQAAISAEVDMTNLDAVRTALTSLLAAINNANTSVASYKIIASGEVPTDKLDGWAISTPKGQLECNTWSNEGDTDGSGMTKPFIQDWAGSGTPLGEGNLYYTLAGLNPGEKYTVAARVRVLNEATGNVEGATFYVNGESKESKDITETCNKGKYAIVSVATEVDAEGKLEFGVHSSSTSQFNWMAIKDVTIAEYAGVKVSNISLNPSNANLNAGEQLTLVATITPDNADDRTLTWTSSDPNVASVTASGVVSALSAGTTTITAKANDGSEATASATITVANAEAPTWFSAVNTGEFYIRNVGTGRFLGQGNSWDTQASLIVHGKPIKVTASNGKYKLTEIVKANAGLGADCYTDNGTPVELTIAEVSPGIYTIDYNGALTAANAGNTIVSYQNIDKTIALAQWQFLTRDDMERNLWTGSDATFYVKGALAQRDASTNSAWTASNVETNYSGTLSSTNAHVCSESWHKDAFSYTQTVTVPNGKYKVSVQGFNDGTSDARLIANEANVQLRAKSSENHGMTCDSRTSAAKVFEAGYYHNEVEVTVTNNTLKLGVEGSSKDCWVAWNNFELELLEYTHVNSITATPEENEIIIGKTTTITTTIDPEDASFPTVYYTSSDESIATVNQDGLVNALATGKVTITAMANNQSAKVEISVIEPLVTLTINVDEANKYATFVAPFEYTVPEGIEAYTVEGVEENGTTLKLTEQTPSVPANTPVVLYAENGARAEVSGVNVAQGATATVGLLTGVYGDLTIKDGYVLQNLPGYGVNFYLVDAEKPITVKANRAYLTLPAGSEEVKALGFGDVVTAIKELEAAKAAKSGIYNVQGQRLNGLQKGINIVDGKKVWVK